jgi:signal transduction histidine kinase
LSSEKWADGPRPSFYGQLLDGRQSASGEDEHDDPQKAVNRRTRQAVAQGRRRRIRSAFGATAPRSPSDAQEPETVWAEPRLLSGHAVEEEELIAQEREEFIKVQFLKAFLADYRDRQVLALATTFLITGICWPYVAKLPLLAWFLARSLMSMVRFGATLIRRTMEDTQKQMDLVRRMAPLSIVNGAILGSAVLLFFGRVPIGLQFVCWMILSGVITLPIPSLALDLPRMRSYIGSFFVVALGCIFYRVVTADAQMSADLLDPHRHYEPWFLVLPFVLWFLTLYMARRAHAQARRGFESDFYKYELIDTLDDSKRHAEEAVQTKNRFLATAAHDMRQPVMALSIYADQLLEGPGDHQAIVPKIAKAAASVNRLFDSLFDLARMDNEQMTLRLDQINISEVMQDLFDQYQPVAAAKGIELKMRTCRRPFTTDPVRLRRMIGNLVSNAIKYTPAGKKVMITARSRTEGLTVDIWDQGIGISLSELQKVFLEFYKVEGVSGATDGFGLGLSIVARLAHALNTHVSVSSQLGRGSVFRLVIGNATAGKAGNRP